jgi:SNF2 family DNA or RNA helicase
VSTTVGVPIKLDPYESTDWQEEDLEQLVQRDWSANWSEMGCYKTTTLLWLIERKMKEAQIEAPRILIVTTKGGKGAYFDALPRTLPDWQVFNLTSRKAEEVFFGTFHFDRDWQEFLKRLHNGKPTIVLAHYNVFSRRKKRKTAKEVDLELLIEQKGEVSQFYPNPALDLLLDEEWHFVACDEAHRIKEKETSWTKFVKKLKIPTGFRHVMTGTGFVNRPDELWSLLNFIAPREFRSYWNFRRYFCLEENYSGYSTVVGIYADKVDEFRDLRLEVGVRRKMAEVHKDVSEPVITPRTVELNTAQRKMYDEIKTILQTMDKNGAPINSPNVLSMLNRLRQITVATPELVREYYDEEQGRRVQEVRLTEPSSKLDDVEEILDELEWDAESKQQIVVFSNFRGPLDLLQARLDKKMQALEHKGLPVEGCEWSYLRLKQEMTDTQRYELWHNIFPEKNHRLFLSTLALGGESISLTSAQYAIFLDRSWSPKDNMQAVGRIYRPGQTSVPNLIYINAERTTDQYVESKLKRKEHWFREIFG